MSSRAETYQKWRLQLRNNPAKTVPDPDLAFIAVEKLLEQANNHCEIQYVLAEIKFKIFVVKDSYTVSLGEKNLDCEPFATG